MNQPSDDPTSDTPNLMQPGRGTNGNSGRPQSDFEFEDAEPAPDPSEFPASDDSEVVPGTAAPSDSRGAHPPQDEGSGA